MGVDKALLMVDGKPLWLRQYELLAAAGAGPERFLSVRSEQAWVPSDVRRVADATADCGPLGGIVAAMATCTCTHLLVLAVDLPRLPGEWFTRLREQIEPGVGAVGQRMSGPFEPLAAIYPRTMVELMAEELSAGRLSLQSVIKRAVGSGLLRLQSIDAESVGWFENWNSPEEIRPRSLPL
jgi:molybdopterin-guanine dinucleotide biosynthesis protein A